MNARTMNAPIMNAPIMNAKTLLATIAFSSTLLASGMSCANDGFPNRLQETSAAATNAGSATVDRSDRDAARIHLKLADSFYRAGNETAAYRYLTFARGELGLSGAPALVAERVVASPDAAARDTGSFHRHLSEAKAAKAQILGREARETATIHLSVAESLHAQGMPQQAREHLAFARSILGLGS